MKKFLPVITSFILLIVVVFFRFYQLGAHPHGLTKDEAYYGYDAYSIMKTGKDIWGNNLPLFFKSTGEYKLNLTYLIIPAIKLFDLSELAVRLPSAIFGLATVFVLYLTLRHLKLSSLSALLLSASFALSPWALGMSRLFFESNVGLFFIAFALYGLIRQWELPSRLQYLTAVSLGLSAYLYGPYRYISLGILALWMLLSYRTRTLTLRAALKLALPYFIISLPIFVATMGSAGTKRLSQEIKLHMPGYVMAVDSARAGCYLGLGENAYLTKLCYALWNKPTQYLEAVVKSGFTQLSPDYLFFKGYNNYITPEDQGAYLSYLFPLYLLGIASLFVIAKNSRNLVILLVVSLIFSTLLVVTTATVEIYRNPVGLYLIFLIMALGYRTISHISKPLIVIFVILAIFQHSKYTLNYFLMYPQSKPLLFGYDSAQIYRFIEPKKDYNIISDHVYYGPIFAAFYWKIDPDYYRQNVVWSEPDPWGWVNASRMDNVYHLDHSVDELLCKKSDNPNEMVKAIVITDPNLPYRDHSSLTTYDRSGTLRLHDIYDIDELYESLGRPKPCK